MKRKVGSYLVLLLLLIQSAALCQDTHTISGFVTDQATGERLINATVYIPSLRSGTTTNLYGFYSVSLPSDSVSVIFSFIGYKSVQSIHRLDSNLRLDVALANNTVLEEVVVEATKDDVIYSPMMGTHRLSMQTVKVSPAIGGETDVMKTLQLLPGVSVGNEGSSGLYVRGGSPDQNLILLDGVPVYNVNHLFGFLSVFNTDALHHVELIKGGIPARYGGRLSSVLNISMKEGNLKEGKGVVSLSPIVGKFAYEAPIVKDKAAFIVSGRRSWLGDLAFPEGESYHLYDLNAKVNTVLNDKNRLYLSVYTGQDKYTRSTDDDAFSFAWGNITTAIRWNTLLGLEFPR